MHNYEPLLEGLSQESTSCAVGVPESKLQVFFKLKYGGMHSETQGLGSEDTWIPGTLWRANLGKAAGSGPMKDQDQKKKRREEEAKEEEERRRKEESKNSRTDVNNTQRTTEVVPWPP